MTKSHRLIEACLAVCLVCALFTLSLVAWAQPLDFAALSVRAYGEQVLDFRTGITTLPEGGEVVDQDAGVRLVGGAIRYLEGEFIEAHEVHVEGGFGSLNAPRIRLDLTDKTLHAEGPLDFTLEGATVRAQRLVVHLQGDILVATGQVQADDPQLEAAALVIDLPQSEALLIGPYRYHQGGRVYRGARGSARLQLAWKNGGRIAVVQDSTALEARLGEFVP